MKDLEHKVKMSELALNRVSLVKNVVLVLLGCALLVLVQCPESVLNQKASQETIVRERAKLILELIKEDDPSKAALGFEVIMASYPDNESEWLREVVQIVFAEAIEPLRSEYEGLLVELANFERELAEVKDEQGMESRILNMAVAATREKLRITKERLQRYEVFGTENGRTN